MCVTINTNVFDFTRWLLDVDKRFLDQSKFYKRTCIATKGKRYTDVTVTLEISLLFAEEKYQ